MTLILTCLTQDYILQVADRRVIREDGTLKDDDTNKAVFYCGGYAAANFAVAYTGPDEMEGESTAEWIGARMMAESNIESAMGAVAKRAEIIFRQNIRYKFAAIACGWTHYRKTPPIQPYVSIVSNFMKPTGFSENSPSDRMTINGGFPLKTRPFLFFPAGQNLTLQEMTRLNGYIDRAVKSDTAAISIARILGDTIHAIANGTDDRAKKVGKGMITHLLPRKAALNDTDSLVILAELDPDALSYTYVSSDGRRDHSISALQACNGLLTQLEVRSIPPRVK